MRGGGEGEPPFSAARYVLTPSTEAKRASIRERRALERATARGVDWWLWRPVVAPQLPDGLADVRRWSFVDLYQAHLVLDTLEALKPEPPPSSGKRR